MARFLHQVWTLARKDLKVIAQRRWLSTFIRALVFPIVLAGILSGVRRWTSSGGYWGVGTPSPLVTFDQALRQTGSTRPDIVLVSRFTGGDIGNVIDQLSTTIQNNGKRVHVVPDAAELPALCISSSRGVSNCYGAVEFLGSPDHGPPGQSWNYTMYGDGSLGGTVDVRRNNNDVQLYSLPFKQAIDSAISKATNGSSDIPTLFNYPFTPESEAYKESQDLNNYMSLLRAYMAFAFFVLQAGLAYHCVGWITFQRERSMLQLIDAMMPNPRIQCIIARMISTHAAFDIIYFIGWLVAGIIMGTVAFEKTPVGPFIAINILTGLAMTSYSILVSSLFKRAQLSAISAIVAALVFAIVAQFAENQDSLSATASGVYATSVLFPPCNYVYFLIEAASYESYGMPLQLSKPNPQSEKWSIAPVTFIGLLVFQIIVFPWLGVMIESMLHGTSSRSRTVSHGENMGGNAVILKNFSKTFKSKVKKGEKVKAVDDLSLNLHAGSITMLLGANGSGKTTTLNAIAGMETVTSGEIQVDNTGGLGICPQKNVTWDELTVKEHVGFFENLKDPSSKPRQTRKLEIERLIVGCDLSVKREARAKSLSGGQKRKLQLAMMLAGGSRVCCIDEASSGIDPLARRRIWDILLAERGSRSMLMTTHFLDEAEVLSDHTLILSKGALKAEGSVATLKNSMGGGFRVTVKADSRLSAVPSPPGVTSSADFNNTVYELPDSAALTSFINSLEQHGIQDYQIQGPTIENVFLKLAHEIKESDLAVKEVSDMHSSSSDSSSETQGKSAPLALNTGRGCSPVKQCWVLFLKRLTILKHNYMPYVAALFVSLTLAGVVTRFFVHYEFPDGIPCVDPNDPSRSTSYRYALDRTTLGYSDDAVYGGVSVDMLRHVLPPPTESYYTSPAYQPNLNNLTRVSSLPSFNNYIAANSSMVYYGGFFFEQEQPTFAWTGASYSSAPTYATYMQTILNNLFSDLTISYGYAEFSQSYLPTNSIPVLVAIFTVLGYSLYPGFFALYPTAERLRNVRAMHYSNGIYSSSLWIAYALFDMMFVLLISVLTIAIWITKWNGWYGLGYMFVVFFLYGLTSTAHAYVVSLFVPSQLAALAASSVIQVIIAMLFFVGYSTTVSNAPSTDIYIWFDYVYYTIALISPSVSLFRALLVCLNVYALACDGQVQASYPADISRYGAPILYLTLQFFVLAAFLMYWESGRSLEVFGIHRKQKSRGPSDPEKNMGAQISADAIEEPERLSENNNGLRIHQVSKSFGKKTLAVDNVSFGILPSEKFALLGVNGAGKTTLLGCIRGDLRPDHGQSDIIIANDSLKQVPVAAKNHLGVCPQFDAVDTMTLKENLTFYARARGVPDKEANIAQLISRLGLTEHQNKLVRKLSGGTQRKLSLAIALVANPKVLLLDEPSSGMDAAAKRALWATLSSIVAGRVLLITTHSMEEADALCDRAGIMAGHVLALGSIDDLRKRHGNAISMHLVHKDSPHTSAEDSRRLKQWVLEAFPSAEVEHRDFGGQLRLSIPRRQDAVDTDLAHLFRIIEQVKDELGIVDYSIGPATLDQVFLNVAYKHNVQEENTAKVEKRLLPRRS